MNCLHELVIDFQVAAFVCFDAFWRRECALCQLGYNHSERVLEPLRAQCKAAWEVNFTKHALDDEDALEIAG